ncbi:MAG TPA: hypothetical protein VG076_14305 [Acidimicrobiales bacterium]|nr:hypothetical protein [Acidimicrobiales bacterium]
MRLRILSIVPLLALIFAACGGGSSNSSSTTSAPSTSTTSASTPGSAVRDAAADARAQKLVLVQADFPTGWTGTPAPATTPEEKAASQELNNCTGSSGDDAKIADVKGDNFSMGSPTTEVGSEAQIAKDEATYLKDVAALKSSKFQPCLETFLTKALTQAASGATPTNVQVSPLTVPKFGDVTVGVRMSAGLTVSGQTITLVIDAVAMGKSRAEVTGTFSNVSQPFDPALENTLINKLGAKLEA